MVFPVVCADLRCGRSDFSVYHVQHKSTVFGRKNDDKTSYTKGNGVILAEHTENRSSYSSKAGEKNLEKAAEAKDENKMKDDALKAVYEANDIDVPDVR